MASLTTITGKQISREISKAVDEFGCPRFFNYKHGLCMDLLIDKCVIDEADNIEFSFQNHVLFALNPFYLTAADAEPSMLPAAFKKAWNFGRQEPAKSLAGCIGWKISGPRGAKYRLRPEKREFTRRERVLRKLLETRTGPLTGPEFREIMTLTTRDIQANHVGY